MKVAYLVDSSAATPENPARDLYMVPLEVIESLPDGGEKRYRAEIDISVKELGDKFAAGSKKFKTASSIVGEVREKVEGLLKKYDVVVGFPISKGISGTIQTWQLIASDIGPEKFHVLDTNAVEAMTMYFHDEVRALVEKEGYDRQKINDLVQSLQKRIAGCVVVDDISQLRAGGRIKTFKAMLIRTLRLKLLIDMSARTGELKYCGNAKTHKGAKEALLDHMDELLDWRKKGIKRITFVSNYADEKEAQKHYAEMKGLLPPGPEMERTHISSVVSVHTGVNVFAILIQTKP